MRTFSGVDLSNPDPLGLGMRQHAVDRRLGQLGNGGSISDYLNGAGFSPSWDTYLESMNGKKLSDDLSQRNIGAAVNTVQNPGQESRQIGRAGIGGALSLAGIDAATKRFRGGR